jgi:hypothetical protein
MINPLEKFHSLTNDIIIVDGFWGSGKSLLNPIVSSMKNVEMVRFDLIYEYVCTLLHLGQITPAAASFLLQSYSDDSQYSNLIGRNTNLRWSDQSGFSQNPYKIRTLRRLFSSEGESRHKEIDAENIALFVMSHHVMSISEPLFSAFGDRLKFIEIVRHPLYLVEHWYAYLSRFDSKRELTPSINVSGVKVPWFAATWSDAYVRASIFDRVLLSLVYFYENLEKTIDFKTFHSDKMLILSFERMVFNSNEGIDEIRNFLGRSHHPRIESIMRRERIPRSLISEGKGYKSYGWEPKGHVSEKAAYSDLIHFVEANATPTPFESFRQVISSYNVRFPSILSDFE